MPVIHDALREEMERLLEKEQAYKKQLSLLPKGRIHDKSIGGKKYPYLTYREDGKKKSITRTYVPFSKQQVSTVQADGEPWFRFFVIFPRSW